jgi:hypothetical protein
MYEINTNCGQSLMTTYATPSMGWLDMSTSLPLMTTNAPQGINWSCPLGSMSLAPHRLSLLIHIGGPIHPIYP